MSTNLAHRLLVALTLFCATFVVLPSSAWADFVTSPHGLPAGTQYRLAFISVTGTTSASPNIADYNTLVTNAANSVPELAALGTTWTAIASTPTVSAEDNTDTNPSAATGLPIYNLGGMLAAANNSALWSGTLTNPINFTQNGFVLFSGVYAWTGTNPDGTSAGANALGGAGANHVVGWSQYSNSQWVDVDTLPSNYPLNFYGISGVLTAVPEPGTLVLAGIAAAGLAATAVQRRRRNR